VEEGQLIVVREEGTIASQPDPNRSPKKRRGGKVNEVVTGKELTLIDFIEPALNRQFEEWEKMIAERVEVWLSGEDLVGCAGFCEYIFNRKWFVGTKPPKDSIVKNKTVVAFALWRYNGLDISTQLLSGEQKKKYRERKRKDFQKLFNQK
jgi:hypothetical protein